MGLTRSEHEVLERGRCQQRRLERTQMAWGCKLQACAAMFVAGATVGNCILKLQQAIIWDAQTDADWINETGKQPPAEGLLHVRLLFAETRSDVCIVLSVYLACGIGCFLVSCGRRTTHRNRFRFTQTHASRLSEGSFRTSAIRLFVGCLFGCECVCVLGWARFWLMSIDAQIDVAKHLLPLSFPKLLLLEPHFHQGNSLRFTQQQCDAPVNPSPSLIDEKQPF